VLSNFGEEGTPIKLTGEEGTVIKLRVEKKELR